MQQLAIHNDQPLAKRGAKYQEDKTQKNSNFKLETSSHSHTNY
jgi:hypothetical protein